ncbi:HET-domain-containing protein [Annulohypoxylon moriforme]|nr:HET-domain-containing protein [Annulohypoxylon moriforme]
MRLINVETLKLHEFQGSYVPRYAILSHTWGEDEVSFQDLQSGAGTSKQGYEKIRFTCEQAKRDRLEWAWIDTCCIDKSSSAELSESINSMYRWYNESSRCYAYLTDIEDVKTFPYVSSTRNGEQKPSRWFTRAWTLQELIAPKDLSFYGHGWKYISPCKGSIDETTLGWYVAGIAHPVSMITRIPMPLIERRMFLSEYSVAQKMSWAAHRSSTRSEDRAYSLLGLFNINMPLLYGEGEKAFIRLQEEILKETDDHSLLCWTVPKSDDRAWTLQSVFAESPDDFSEAGEIRGNPLDSGHPSAVTNRGLQIHLPLTERRYGEGSHLYYLNAVSMVFDAALNAVECELGRFAIKNQLSIQLIRTPHISNRHQLSTNRHARLATPSLGRTAVVGRDADMMKEMEIKTELVYIHKTLFDWERDRFGCGGVHLQNIPISKSISPFSSIEGNPTPLWIKSVLYPGLKEELYDVTTQGVPRNSNHGITWSPIYGCIKFDSIIQLDTKLPAVVIFKVDFDYTPLFGERNQFSILLAWDEDYIHFSLRPRVSIPNIIDPHDTSTYRKDYRETYGEIARTRALLGVRDIELILEREDPNTEDGEAAGDRLHFLIRAIDHGCVGERRQVR